MKIAALLYDNLLIAVVIKTNIDTTPYNKFHCMQPPNGLPLSSPIWAHDICITHFRITFLRQRGFIYEKLPVNTCHNF